MAETLDRKCSAPIIIHRTTIVFWFIVDRNDVMRTYYTMIKVCQHDIGTILLLFTLGVMCECARTHVHMHTCLHYSTHVAVKGQCRSLFSSTMYVMGMNKLSHWQGTMFLADPKTVSVSFFFFLPVIATGK